MHRFKIGEHLVDLDAATLSAGEQSCHITPIESRLLGYLARRPGEIIAREELLTEVWGYRPGVESRSIDSTVLRLREKLGEDSIHLQALYKRGLKLEGVAQAELVRVPGEPLFGRSRELAEALEAISGRARLLTLVGPGGVGKSRLAEEILARCGPLDVIKIAVSPLDERAGLELKLLEAMKIEPKGPARLLIERLLPQRGRIVIALDECEEAIDAVRACALQWLAAAPRLRILATSRAALGAPLEQILALEPLDEASAAQLLLDRARRVAPAWSPPAEGLLALVRALDALPLALELAAARAPALGLPAMLDLLGRSVEILETPRASMRAVIDRSLKLLSGEEILTLRACATFEGLFSLELLSEVCGLGAAGAKEALSELCARSLVRKDGEQLLLMQVIRARVREKIPADDPLWTAHARTFAREAAPEVFARRPFSDYIFRSEPDLTAAMERMREREPETAARCGLLLLQLAGRVMLVSRGLEIAERLLQLSPVSAILRVRIAAKAGIFCMQLAQIDRGIELLEQAISDNPPPVDHVYVRTTLAQHHKRRGDLDEALRQLAACESDLPQSWHGAVSWWQCMAYLRADDHNKLVACLEEALAQARRLNLPRLEARCLMDLVAETDVHNGDFEAIEEMLARIESIMPPAGVSPALLAQMAFMRAIPAFNVGEIELAEREIERARRFAVVSGWNDNVALCDITRAMLAMLDGRSEEAIEILDATSLDQASESMHTQALVARARVALWDGDDARAKRMAESVLPKAIAKGWFYIESYAREVLAVASLDPSLLDAAAPLDARAIGEAIRSALRALISARLGRESALSEIAIAEGLVERLSLRETSEVAGWIRRARAALSGSLRA